MHQLAMFAVAKVIVLWQLPIQLTGAVTPSLKAVLL